MASFLVVFSRRPQADSTVAVRRFLSRLFYLPLEKQGGPENGRPAGETSPASFGHVQSENLEWVRNRAPGVTDFRRAHREQCNHLLLAIP